MARTKIIRSPGVVMRIAAAGGGDTTPDVNFYMRQNSNAPVNTGGYTRSWDTADAGVNGAGTWKVDRSAPKMASAGDVDWEINDIEVVTAPTTAKLTWSSKVTVLPANPTNVSIKLEKPDTSVVTLSTRAVTAAESAYNTITDVDVTTDFSAAGVYNVRLHMDHASNTNAGTIFYDDIQLKFT